MITRLSERHLASLYDKTRAPAILHSGLHSADGADEERLTRVRDIIKDSPPDLALISLGLCAVVLAEYCQRYDIGDHTKITEMKYLGIESVETFGPAYLGEDIGLDDLTELLQLCPVQLAALGSMFEEIEGVEAISSMLIDMAYDQADLAEELLSGNRDIDDTPASTQPVIHDGDNVVALDLFAAFRKKQETAEE